MLKKYISKFTIDILPSVAATVIGAYIVNHYIVTRPGTDAPVAAAASAADPKAPAKAAETGNPPTAGVRAKGISEKALLEKTAAERPTVVEKVEAKADVKADVKADAKPADAPAETASVPAEPRATRAAPREREKEKIRVVLPSPVQPVAPAVAAAPPAPVAAPPVETAVVPDDRRDANDLARAAIERLRVNNDGSPRAPEVVRTPEAQRVETTRIETPRIETPRSEMPRVATAPALRPLPPPISVSTPSGGETFDQGRPPYAANASVDPRRPTPPAEIPVSRPLDLRADVPEPSVRERSTAVAEDVLSTAKSLFHAVLPK
ncbi:hypothetical protein [Bradyrhizobium sp. OAE829]|uniref:hypothetical protein n=1 Tax=Bradyrhizobium sp. OAE829 TaxID=2663807 RepID=UPI001A014001